MAEYSVTYEHDGAMWVACIASLDGCHTQGRTPSEARARLREALALFDDDAANAVFVDEPSPTYAKLTPGARVRIGREFKEMTQSELEAAAGMLSGAIAAIEGDYFPLSVTDAQRIAGALGVDVAVLLG